jgi:DNA-binding IclR family transcriptional regulator
MVDLAKLEQWVEANPSEAEEPFMNITTQRTITLKTVYEELKQEKETGVAIVDEEVLSIVRELDDWLGEV